MMIMIFNDYIGWEYACIGFDKTKLMSKIQYFKIGDWGDWSVPIYYQDLNVWKKILKSQKYTECLEIPKSIQKSVSPNWLDSQYYFQKKKSYIA